MASALVVAPTATAVEMHAGELIWLVEPSLPEAMAVNTPAPRRLSIAGFCDDACRRCPRTDRRRGSC